MHFEWLLSPITMCIALAAGLAGCLALFITLKVEIRTVSRSASESADAANSALRGFSTELTEMRKNVQNFNSTPVNPVSRQGINFSKRTHALRMYRRGEPIHSIAPALGVPRNEIELLLKVHSLLNPPNP